MIISIIAALDERGTIGQDNRIPWRQAADLKRFRHLTSGHHVVMGRRTYESLPLPRVLPDRKMIVLSTTDEFARSLPDHVIHQRSIFSAIEYAENVGETELFLIGGWEVYMMGLLFADRMYLTKVRTSTKGKVTKFPEIAWREWEMRQSAGPYLADANNQHPYTFEQYDRLTEDVVEAKRREKRLKQYEAHRIRTMTDTVCEGCGKAFRRALADVKASIKNGRQIFCSNSCAAKTRNALISHVTSISCICEKCGVQFTRPASLAKNKHHYCSRVCYQADLKRVRNL
jgi:dihydrofolate reductase